LVAKRRTVTNTTNNIAIAGHELEVRIINPVEPTLPTIVFLHEGLGCVSLWREFPQQITRATGMGALIYSRYGYGRSSTLAEQRAPDYMHSEALDVLPALLLSLGMRKPILYGHSDGASIALIHAGAGHPVTGLIVEAPHVFVEEISLQGAAQAAITYRTTDLPKKLARHHRDPDKTFWGWHDIWTSPSFRDWNIESYLPAITCPTLLIQGEQDEYGTVAQIDAIAGAVKGATFKHLLPNCGHTPHRDQAEVTLQLVTSFLHRLVL
jgi:pimeloyl-ACP methyl ester carboxylesterase